MDLYDLVTVFSLVVGFVSAIAVVRHIVEWVRSWRQRRFIKKQLASEQMMSRENLKDLLKELPMSDFADRQISASLLEIASRIERSTDAGSNP